MTVSRLLLLVEYEAIPMFYSKTKSNGLDSAQTDSYVTDDYE